jgi:hypothetical protein
MVDPDGTSLFAGFPVPVLGRCWGFLSCRRNRFRCGGVHRPGADKRSADKVMLNVPGTECLDHKRNDCRPVRVDCVFGGRGNFSGLLMDIAASML